MKLQNMMVQGAERGGKMSVLKLSLTENEMSKLKNLAEKEKLSLQDYIRYRIFGEKSPSKFTPEEAERRAIEKFTVMDDPFTLPEIYEDEWYELSPRMTGVFGKRFFNYLKNSDNTLVEFVGMTKDRRRATYRIKEG